MPALRAILFDFDGLIVDTESAIYEAWRELYLSEGHDLPREVYVQCVGSTFGHYDPMEELERLTGRSIDWTARLAVKNARIRELQRDLNTMPGVRDLLAACDSSGLRRAVASSSDRQHVHGWLDRVGLKTSFQAIRSRDDVARPKPAPDLFLAALDALGVAAEEAIVLEDSLNGLRAANAAGVPCIVVPSPVTLGLDFSAATAIIPTLHGHGPAELAALAGLSWHA